MSVAASLLALVAVSAGAGAGPDSAEPARSITYQVRVAEMNGVGWREMLYFRLTPLARQGATCVWRTDAATARAIAEKAAHVTAAPRLTAAEGATAKVATAGAGRPYVADVTRKANGPLHHASELAFLPRSSEVAESVSTQLQGQACDQGLRLHVACDATWVAAIHRAQLAEVCLDSEGLASGLLKPYVEVPEMAAAHVDGEWLLPTNEVLVVSLGVHSSADGERTASDSAAPGAVRVCERLLLVQPSVECEPAGKPRPSTAAAPSRPAAPAAAGWIRDLTFEPAHTPGAPARLTFRLRVAPSLPSAPSAIATAPPAPAPAADSSTIPLPMPLPPSRSLPLAGGATALEPLPPLPDEAAKPATFVSSGTPMPSPQAPHAVAVGSLVEPEPKCDCPTCPHHQATAAAGWHPIEVAPPLDPGMIRAVFDRLRAAQAAHSEHSGTLRIPLGGKLAVEIRASVKAVPRD